MIEVPILPSAGTFLTADGGGDIFTVREPEGAGALHSVSDYVQAFLNLLPRGRVWPKDASAVQVQFITGLCGLLAGLDAAAQQALLDASPATTLNLLPEWEETLGLPDPCYTATPTILQRQMAVRARFGAVAGFNLAFYVAYAAALGYTVTITPSAPFRIGISGMGDGIGPESYFSVWDVNAVPNDPVIQCELRAIAPAEIVLVFG